MNEPETIKSAVEAAANHPVIASAVAASTTTMGTFSILSQTQTILGIVSVAIGCVVGLFVIRVHWIKYKLLRRQWDSGGMLPREIE